MLEISAIWRWSDGGGEVGLGEFGLRLFDLLLDLGEFALEGERALRAGTAAGDGDVVEGLAGGREEEGVRDSREPGCARCRSRVRRSPRGAWAG